jgi:copper chaperone CopZ
LYASRGVKTVDVDLNGRTVTVTLPERGGASLGQLWYAVEQGEGGPTQLVTPAATYSFAATPADGQAQVASTTTYVVVDNLHCMGCAQKIARQLYAVKGVTKVSADLPKDTLVVETRPDIVPSPWTVIEAVARAKERPVAVTGNYGTLSVQWATERAPKSDHQQAQQPTVGGIQR